MLKSNKTWIGSLLVIVTLVTATYLTFLSDTRNGLEIDPGQRDSVSSFSAPDVPEEMRALTHLFRTIHLVQKRYLDSSRIDPRKMFVSAMRSIQIHVAKVMVQEVKDTLVVKMGGAERHFMLNDLKTPWILLQRIKEVFDFLRDELQKEKIELHRLEQAAINGMLRTLDPHSVFLNSDQYREMRDKTQGKFAGLGIVISIRDGVLTIISPIDGTPADLAGLQAGDQIVKIDEASTVNMSLNDAVDLLRGDPGTTVTVHILRKGWDASKAFKIVRAIVKVDSLESHMLKGRVGYIKIKDFQGNTASDIQALMVDWQKQGLGGLVLDLRQCPGGLLEAAVQVSDLFLKKGVIVTTAGQGPGERDVRRAVSNGDEPEYPVTVLVDRGSASASEILAGALKNHGRALLIGERTFGKGSVQVLFEFQDESGKNETTALKLTTAQYLTPGDVSIQSTGVNPHIELMPMRADDEIIDLKVVDGYRESDLDQHLEMQNDKRAVTGPMETLSYLWTPPKNAPKDGETPDGGIPLEFDKKRPFEPDYAVELARDFVTRLASAKGGYLNLQVLTKRLEQKRDIEEKRLVNALKAQGIDWRGGQNGGDPSKLSVVLSVGEKGVLKAGEKTALTMRITNNDSRAFYRLGASSESDYRILDDRELAFGKIGPGQTVERKLKLRVPKDSQGQVSDVRWTFDAHGSDAPKPVALRFEVAPMEKPHFAYQYKLDDSENGNGDGKLQPGETIKILLDIQNVGKGEALDTYATLKGMTEKGLFMVRGRELLKTMKPGEHKNAEFSFELKPEFSEGDVRFELAVSDVDLRIFTVESLALPVVHGKGTTEMDDKKIAVADTPKDGFRYAPKIDLDPVELATQSDSFILKGEVSDETQIQNVYIFVGDDKLFYQSNRDNPDQKKMNFQARLPLENGINWITIVAAENADIENRRIIAVRRDRDDGMPYLLSRIQDADPEPLGVLPRKSVDLGEETPDSEGIAAKPLVADAETTGETQKTPLEGAKAAE